MSGFECRILPKVNNLDNAINLFFNKINIFSVVLFMMNLLIEMEYGIYKMKLLRNVQHNHF